MPGLDRSVRFASVQFYDRYIRYIVPGGRVSSQPRVPGLAGRAGRAGACRGVPGRAGACRVVPGGAGWCHGWCWVVLNE